MSFSIGELQDWLQRGEVGFRLRRADGTPASDAMRELLCRAAVTDSRNVESGFLFCAAQGENTHGVQFLGAALSGGAAAVLVEGPAPVFEEFAVPFVEVGDARLALAAAARGWLEDRAPRVIGIRSEEHTSELQSH